VLVESVVALHPAIEEHDDRLDEHEVSISSHALKLADLRATLEKLLNEQHRLADVATAQSGTLEILVRNTARTVALLEPK